MIAAIEAAKILGVRAGQRSDHKFTGVWPIVVGDRVFARSWTQAPGGWYHSFQEEPLGVLQVGERQVRVRAVPVRSERILDAIEAGYAAKYPTPGSRTFVRGFRSAKRRAATLEFQRR